MSETEAAGEPDVDTDELFQRQLRIPTPKARRGSVSCPSEGSLWPSEESVRAAQWRYVGGQGNKGVAGQSQEARSVAGDHPANSFKEPLVSILGGQGHGEVPRDTKQLLNGNCML